MLWAIDVGNTHTVFAAADQGTWKAVFRLSTPQLGTEDELAAKLNELCGLSGIPFQADRVGVASVAPHANESIARFGAEWWKAETLFLEGDDFGVPIDYEPKSGVGADRLANALAAKSIESPPLVVIDVGTATTFDVLNPEGRYLGGAILPGPETLMNALTTRTAKLPSVPLAKPAQAVGRNTAEALQSGIVLGYVGAIEAVLAAIRREIDGDLNVIATGGQGEVLFDLCPSVESYEPMLTLDGIKLAMTSRL